MRDPIAQEPAGELGVLVQQPAGLSPGPLGHQVGGLLLEPGLGALAALRRTLLELQVRLDRGHHLLEALPPERDRAHDGRLPLRPGGEAENGPQVLQGLLGTRKVRLVVGFDPVLVDRLRIA